ncbi:hypothetical protein CLU83_3714 [Flavobacterium sp. 1]|uniref:hypothetical protein n=1 Tax=Flavobacterium sp. 1 TaxID=2035200 RepID=UPI000C24DE04|nr:hypothetical protein [Flavobacterium sp. 1]PJJ10311.1 hypothetical protein CLU83_3714 [Flavobacterium sp. 1]
MLFDTLIEESEEIVVLTILLEELSFSLEEGIMQYIYKAEIQTPLKGNLIPKKEIRLITNRYKFLSGNNGESILEETNIMPGDEYIAFLMGAPVDKDDSLPNYQLIDRWLGLNKISVYKLHYIQNRK